MSGFYAGNPGEENVEKNNWRGPETAEAKTPIQEGR